MLNQPINVIPSVLSGVGEGVVDATLPLAVSWQVSGDTPMVAYSIVIMQNDTASTQKYTTGKVTLSNPFYGTDRNGNVRTFRATAITASQLSTAGIVNGYANGYKLLITQWWGSTDAESITQTSPSYFITRDEPEVFIITQEYSRANPYDKKDITLNAVFQQAQGDTVKTVRWYLYEGHNDINGILLLDTGDIETQLLQFEYDGLFPSTYYYIKCEVQSSSGTIVSDDAIVYVYYSLGQDVGEVNVCKPHGKDYIEVSWNARGTIDGTVSGGDVSYSEGSLVLEDGVSLSYSPLSIQPNWSVVWRGSAAVTDGDIQVLTIECAGNNTYQLELSRDYATYILGGNIIFRQAITGHTGDGFVIVITPTHYYIRQDTFTGGTIPSASLYPSTTLYPSDVTYVTRYFDGDISYTQYEITSISLGGEQICDYILVESGELSEETIQQLIGDTYYQPIIDYNTMFLSRFDGDTTTAYISGTGGNGLGSAIYRREYGKPILDHVVDVSGGITSIRDYGAKSRTQYQYYVFVIGIDIYAEAFGSDTIIPQYNNYTLMECIYNSTDGAYHVQATYPFACNVNQGSISNNNTPSILQNFTKYPNRQSVNTLYASGSLSALIGTVNQEQATYTDSWELADKINALSTSLNPKFLRDMKGKIWRIETSESIVTEINTSNKFIPLRVTIPWVEVGTADGVSIVATQGDPVYSL